VLLHAIGDGLNLLLWSQDSFAFADGFDDAGEFVFHAHVVAIAND
jgi:hypothetical protein